MNFKTLIIGSYGASNIGDEAMLEIILKYLPENWEKRVLSGNPEDTKMRHHVEAALHLPFGIRSFFSFRWIESLSFLQNSDLILLGGGGLFVDDYTVKAILLWTWHVFWARIFRKKVILFANSVGPVKSRLGKVLTKWSLNQCEKIIVRDEISAECVRSLLSQKEVIVGADLVFLFPVSLSLSKASATLREAQHNTKKKLLALNLRPWEIDTSSVKEFLDSVKKEGYRVMLIATEEADREFLLPFVDAKTTVVTPKDFSELIELLSSCEKAIGMRLHFLIGAALAGCELSGIAYSSKVQAILHALNISYFLPKDISFELLNQSFQEAKQAENLDEMKVLAESMFDIIKK